MSIDQERRDALEELRPVVADHPCARAVYHALDQPTPDWDQIHGAAVHIERCDDPTHHRARSAEVILDLLATICGRHPAADTPIFRSAHPSQAFHLDIGNRRCYSAAIAALLGYTLVESYEDAQARIDAQWARFGLADNPPADR